jgi:colanic acid biosynthesis glycosyl transferase WcaI
MFYRPELTGVAKYTAEMCEGLAARGHEVRVVAPPPYYPQWRVQAPYSLWSYSSETLGSVRVRRCPIWLPKRPGGISRALYMLSFALSSLPVMLREAWRGPDVVVVIQPSFFNSITSLFASRLSNAPAWLHIQDFELDLAYDLGQLRRGRRIAERIESRILGRFDAVSSITRRMVGRAREKGVAPERLFLLPNWFDPSRIYPSAYCNELRRELAIPEGSLVALFAGSLGAKQGVETIVAAAKLSDAAVTFLIAGDGIAAEVLRSQAEGLSNIQFVPLQPADRLNELLNLAAIHLLPQQPAASVSVMPSKLIGMLASGRPVVATAVAGSDIAELVEGCGVLAPPGDAPALAAAIRRLVADPAERSRLGAAARERALDLFQEHVILDGLERNLQRLVAASGGRAPVPMTPK